jgi:signal transduction histidine kinase
MRRRKTAIFFLVLGISLSAIAVVLNITWILLNLREVMLLVLGIIFFALIITGLILNTIFLLREIRRNEQHDAFLNAVTHELKTPIASIKLYLETLRSRDLDDEKRAEFYDIMLADNARLLGTVEQVLHASSTREKRRQLNLAEIDLGDLLSKTISTVLGRNRLGEGAIRFQSAPNAVKVLGDRVELQTVFSNLLDNAIKYSGDDPKISVRLKAAEIDRVDVFIRDNGIGIQRTDLKRVFKRFYRVPNSAVDAVRGTGLGLAIVRAIVERHGGRVRAQSKGIGKGATFLVRLPTI